MSEISHRKKEHITTPPKQNDVTEEKQKVVIGDVAAEEKTQVVIGDVVAEEKMQVVIKCSLPVGWRKKLFSIRSLQVRATILNEPPKPPAKYIEDRKSVV